MLFQVLLDDGSKSGISGLGGVLWCTAQLFKKLCTARIFVAVVVDGRCVTSYGVGDTLRLTFVQHLHKGLQGTQAAGKAAISISMYQYFFNLVHGHSVIQPAGKGGFQILQVAGGGIGGNGNDALLAETERVCLLCQQGSAASEQ